MKRSIAKAVEDYRKKHYKDGNQRGLFYASDFYQVKDLATLPDGRTDLYTAISVSLEAGYEIGYRTAQRHLRKRGIIT